MTHVLVQQFEAQSKKTAKKTPQVQVGSLVKVHQKIKEGEKFRTQIFAGLVIKKHNVSDLNASITVRKVVDGIGVEKVFPIHSPFVEKIEVSRQFKVRGAKLYYMRTRSGKSARLKEIQVAIGSNSQAQDDDDDIVMAPVEEVIAEAPKATVEKEVHAAADEATPEEVAEVVEAATDEVKEEEKVEA